jgi:hypothetical protein
MTDHAVGKIPDDRFRDRLSDAVTDWNRVAWIAPPRAPGVCMALQQSHNWAWCLVTFMVGFSYRWQLTIPRSNT